MAMKQTCWDEIKPQRRHFRHRKTVVLLAIASSVYYLCCNQPCKYLFQHENNTNIDDAVAVPTAHGTGCRPHDD